MVKWWIFLSSMNHIHVMQGLLLCTYICFSNHQNRMNMVIIAQQVMLGEDSKHSWDFHLLSNSDTIVDFGGQTDLLLYNHCSVTFRLKKSGSGHWCALAVF